MKNFVCSACAVGILFFGFSTAIAQGNDTPLTVAEAAACAEKSRFLEWMKRVEEQYGKDEEFWKQKLYEQPHNRAYLGRLGGAEDAHSSFEYIRSTVSKEYYAECHRPISYAVYEDVCLSDLGDPPFSNSNFCKSYNFDQTS